MNLVELKGKSSAELTTMADELKVEGVSGMRKQELIFAILQAQTEKLGACVDAMLQSPAATRRLQEQLAGVPDAPPGFNPVTAGREDILALAEHNVWARMAVCGEYRRLTSGAEGQLKELDNNVEQIYAQALNGVVAAGLGTIRTVVQRCADSALKQGRDFDYVELAAELGDIEEALETLAFFEPALARQIRDEVSALRSKHAIERL